MGHDANTTLHLAELIAGVPYRVPKYCTVNRGGVAVRVDYGENDHCCERFALLEAWLESRGLQREGEVGHAAARLVRSRDVVAVATERLAEDPLIFLHPPASRCPECDAARASVGAGATR